VGGYTTNILYASDERGNPTAFDPLGNFISKVDFSQVSFNEQFSPLIGFDMTLKNSMSIRVEFKKGRNVSLSFANNQITEMGTNELVITTGYRFKDIKIGFVFSGMKRQVVSDLNLSVSFALKDNITTLRKIEENQKQVSSGMMNMLINVTADYQISQMVGLRYYYTHNLNKPYISTQYDNLNIETGITVRLMLTQ